MIETLKEYKTLLSIIAIVLIAFVGYSMFSDGRSSSNALTSQNVSIGGSKDNELILLLVNLRSITLDESFFNDLAFKRLIDFGQALVAEPTGRENPFAPVGSDSF